MRALSPKKFVNKVRLLPCHVLLFSPNSLYPIKNLRPSMVSSRFKFRISYSIVFFLTLQMFLICTLPCFHLNVTLAPFYLVWNLFAPRARSLMNPRLFHSFLNLSIVEVFKIHMRKRRQVQLSFVIAFVSACANSSSPESHASEVSSVNLSLLVLLRYSVIIFILVSSERGLSRLCLHIRRWEIYEVD